VDAATPQPADIALQQPALLPATSPAIPHQLLHELAVQAHIHEVALTQTELSQTLTTLGQKLNFNQPPNQPTTPQQQEHFYRGLQLQDLALARACALGREQAWQQFIARFKSPLRQAAIGITKSTAQGEDLADGLYAELYGLSERDGNRRSPLATYSGRGSLMGWLRTTLTQRHIDHHRRTRREEPLPDPQTGHELAATTPAETPEPAALTQLTAALQRTLRTLPPEDRFLLSSYFLDQQTLQQIARLLQVHEATVSRKLKRLTTEVHKQLLKQLQAAGLSKRAAEEAITADPRNLTLNLRTILQSSQPQPFSIKRGTA
jgi:RNA polymerase sigma-70 factor (ECF subfamily)